VIASDEYKPSPVGSAPTRVGTLPTPVRTRSTPGRIVPTAVRINLTAIGIVPTAISIVQTPVFFGKSAVRVKSVGVRADARRMAVNIPKTNGEFLAWARVHADAWTQAAGEIGLSEEQAAQYAAACETLAAAQKAALEARAASMAATMTYQRALAEARALSGRFVAVIKAHAEVADDPGVYSAAGIEPDAPMGTLPEPRPPRIIRSSLTSLGAVVLTWTARQPRGVTDVSYLVHRRLPGETGFTLIGAAGRSKAFADETLPIGIARVEYLLRPVRGERLGAWSAVHTVQMGSVAATSVRNEERGEASSSPAGLRRAA
jgi:hypothetical protein